MATVITASRAGNYLFGYGVQTAQGTVAASYKYARWQEGTTANPNPNIEIVPEGDTSAQYLTTYKKYQWWEWKLSFWPRANEAALFWACLLGAGSDLPTTSGTATAHALSFQSSFQNATKCAMLTLQLTFIDQYGPPDTGRIVTLTDCVVNEIKVAQAAGSPLKYDVSGYGITLSNPSAISAQTSSVPTPTFDVSASSQLGMMYLHQFALDTYATTAPQLLAVKEYNLTVNRGVHPEDLTTTGLNPASYVPTMFLVNADYSVVWQDWTNYLKVYTNSTTGTTAEAIPSGIGKFTSSVLFDNATSFASSTAAVQMQVPQMAYKTSPLEPRLDEKPLILKITGQGIRGAADSFLAVARNSQTTAYC